VAVFGSVYLLGRLAQDVGGECVDVSWGVEGGVSPARVGPNPGLRTAQILILTGVEPVVPGTTSTEREPDRILRVGAVDAELAPDGLWLDPAVLASTAQSVHAGVARRRPKQQAALASGLDRTLATLRQADADLTALAAAARGLPKQPAVLTAVPHAKRLLARAGVAVLEGPAGAVDLLSDLPRWRKQADAADAIAIEAHTPDVVADEVARVFGRPVVRIDTTGGSAAANRRSVRAVLDYNLAQLRTLVPATTTQPSSR
jgi:ABC-type Zn uptake system ZnuABC Zn-binding protein ZnuA